jgi:hypothetical protein
MLDDVKEQLAQLGDQVSTLAGQLDGATAKRLRGLPLAQLLVDVAAIRKKLDKMAVAVIKAASK